MKPLKFVTVCAMLMATTLNAAMACDGSFECTFKTFKDGENRNVCTRLANHQVNPTDWDPDQVATMTKVCAAKFNIKFPGSDDVLRTWCNEIGNRESEDRDAFMDANTAPSFKAAAKFCATQYNIKVNAQ
jgi:hypothetical protein